MSAASLPSTHVMLRCPHPLLPFRDPNSSCGGAMWGNPKAEAGKGHHNRNIQSSYTQLSVLFWRKSHGGELPAMGSFIHAEVPRRSPKCCDTDRSSHGRKRLEAEQGIVSPVLTLSWSPRLLCGPSRQARFLAVLLLSCSSWDCWVPDSDEDQEVRRRIWPS